MLNIKRKNSVVVTSALLAVALSFSMAQAAEYIGRHSRVYCRERIPAQGERLRRA